MIVISYDRLSSNNELFNTIEIISSSQSKLTSTNNKTESTKNNYAKLDRTFSAFVFIFLTFSVVLLTAEKDYTTDKQKQSEVKELTTTYA